MHISTRVNFCVADILRDTGVGNTHGTDGLPANVARMLYLKALIIANKVDAHPVLFVHL